MLNYYPLIIKRKKKNNKTVKIFLAILSFVAIFAAAIIALIIFFANKTIKYYIHDIPDVSVLSRWTPPETTKIYSSGENLLYEPHGSEVRTAIAIGEIPNHLKNAFIAVEDKRFWQHFGIDASRVISSAIHNWKHPKDGIQGGSTITQQLVKNCLLGGGKNFKRKLQEAILALLLEKRMSKEKILEMYLNQIPFGSNIYGIEAAAQRFWSKSANELGLAESAVLAAIPKASSYFSPYENQPALLERQKIVLNLLLEQKMISPEEFYSAKSQKIVFNKPAASITYPHFTLYALNELEEQFGKETAKDSGLKAITTINERLQKIAEESITSHLSKIKKIGADNAALVAIEAKTGNILAMAGSVDFWDKNSGQYNAAMAYRQPGSTFKPLVYVSAFDTGDFTPETIVIDSFVNFNGYKPRNFDGAFHGALPIRLALANSHNIPAVKTLNRIGLEYFSKKMEQLEIEIKPETGLPAALGAESVPLLKMVSAYASFANGGKFNPPNPFKKILNRNGDAIKEYSPRNIPVFSSESAKMINSILSDYSARISTFGNLRRRLELKDRPVAAKTGTTDDRRDAWTIGYTPSIACGVWVGNNDNSPMGRKAEGVTAAAPIWKEFMEKAAEGTEIENF